MSETLSPDLDLREALFGAQEWCATIVERVPSAALAASTPCSAFDVRALMAHIGMVFEKLVAFGELHRDPRFGEEITPEEFVKMREEPAGRYVDGLSPAARGNALRVQSARAHQLWDDALLDTPIQLGWGPVLPGRAVAAIYLMECVAHGWDLTVATSQPSEAPPAVAEPALAAALRGLPESPRGVEVGVPFGPVVPSRDDAGRTERLANWTGRASPA